MKSKKRNKDKRKLNSGKTDVENLQEIKFGRFGEKEKKTKLDEKRRGKGKWYYRSEDKEVNERGNKDIMDDNGNGEGTIGERVRRGRLIAGKRRKKSGRKYEEGIKRKWMITQERNKS